MSKTVLSETDLINICTQTNIESDVIKSWHKGKFNFRYKL